MAKLIYEVLITVVFVLLPVAFAITMDMLVNLSRTDKAIEWLRGWFHGNRN